MSADSRACRTGGLAGAGIATLTARTMRAMPELPEVEVTRRGLEPALTGSRIVAARLGKPLRWPLGASPEHLSGQRIAALGRRGKYLLLQLDDGWLIVHLGMSGSLRWTPRELPLEPIGPHDHVELVTDRGTLRLRDPRRFGAVVWTARIDDHPLLRAIGPEPLSPDFDGARLLKALQGRHAAIKQLLLSQAVVAGVGNIYASEALFLAGIAPQTPASRLGPLHCDRLAGAIRHTLSQAVELGGSTLRDFAHADGELGYFQHAFRVYGREGEPCHHEDGGTITRIVQGGRSTWFCPVCQR